MERDFCCCCCLRYCYCRYLLTATCPVIPTGLLLQLYSRRGDSGRASTSQVTVRWQVSGSGVHASGGQANRACGGGRERWWRRGESLPTCEARAEESYGPAQPWAVPPRRFNRGGKGARARNQIRLVRIIRGLSSGVAAAKEGI